MQCEQFIAVLSEIAVASPNIEKILTLEELEFLIHLGNGAQQPICLRTIINDNYGAISYIEPVQDEYHRKGVWNHTIIINLKEYFHSTNPLKLFTNYFFTYQNKMPKKLQTLRIEENVSTPTIPQT